MTWQFTTMFLVWIEDVYEVQDQFKGFTKMVLEHVHPDHQADRLAELMKDDMMRQYKNLQRESLDRTLTKPSVPSWYSYFMWLLKFNLDKIDWKHVADEFLSKNQKPIK